MFSENDIAQIQSHGTDLKTVNQQIKHFVDGFPFMKLEKAATVNSGITRLSELDLAKYISLFEKESSTLSLLKFVPASGAATRMFKALFGFLENGKSDKSTDQFFERLTDFAFFNDLSALLPQNADHKTIADYFLTEKGLDYGNLPKGLLKFHPYETGPRTPVEEHLVEAAHYATGNGVAKLHFTVSPEHKNNFNDLITKVLESYKTKFGIDYTITFSEQKSSTDTIAVNPDNTPFREKDDSLLFRPAGHGALLENLNAISADIVFIKNIDNVVPDRLKQTTFDYKKALAGILLEYQTKIFDYLKKLQSPASDSLLEEIAVFLENELCILPEKELSSLSNEEKSQYFITKLNRPIRVCGVVPNTGEPGGGPFWCKNADNTTSLQIVESAQVDMDNAEQKSIFNNSTHFNPVDLICSLKDHLGNAYDLLNFRDPKTGFITAKSKDGKDLKAQELPGLWNGSMADWNTFFVEVPLITFNPVKTVNDLLREEHQ
ncbi:protein of unknown function [Pseudarcicella hirudinis]|uniref:DUF4301 domain-containing protein n=1 Tax=Pseudarcicella hirudinis TaxID=1079859 RepID=A0A1I5WMC8_9BACT|nr:DUF4301 family protein [Pseudarcicella hirudinis]SFQ20944.1 protein of unknown function [Pseudarcicella hirudinis]